MRLLKNITLFLCLSFWAIACNNSNQRVNNEDVNDNSYIEITDAAGRKVNISKSSKFIVIHSKTEIFRILDAESKVEGVTRWTVELNTEVNPVLSKLPSIGGFSKGNVNYEMIYKIVNDSPEDDVILVYNQSWADDIESKIGQSDKIKIIKLNLFGSNEPQKEIAILAKALGKEAECKRYINWFDSLLLMVQTRVRDIPDEEKIKVYWDAPSEGYYNTSGGGSSADIIISRAGGKFISEKLPQSGISVSPEWILQENPDIILAHPSSTRLLTGVKFDYGSAAVDTTKVLNAWNELIATPGISGTDAVKEKKVYFIDDLMFGPSQPVGTVVLAKLFYPEKFADINPREMLKYYYEYFMKLDYKGFYLYPNIFDL